MYRFNCDYLEGCHPEILKQLEKTNLEQTPGYGEDCYCEEAAELIREAFHCPQAHVHFLTGGTQANTTVISAALRPWEGVLSAHTGHINVHETGAIESSGHKVIALEGKDGRISGSQISVALALQGDDEHMVKPGMAYISHSTELGTIYSLAQLTDLYHVCHDMKLKLFIDGARLGYALQSPVSDITPDNISSLCDVFTIGGTKVGALFGEAVVINDPELNDHFRYMMKQRGGMLAKGRLLGLQFGTLMKNSLYFDIAKKAVDQAMAIRTALLDKEVQLLVDSPTNQLFPVFSDHQLEYFEDQFLFETWERIDESHTAVRICTSWATKNEAVDELIHCIEAM